MKIYIPAREECLARLTADVRIKSIRCVQGGMMDSDESPLLAVCWPHEGSLWVLRSIDQCLDLSNVRHYLADFYSPIGRQD